MKVEIFAENVDTEEVAELSVIEREGENSKYEIPKSIGTILGGGELVIHIHYTPEEDIEEGFVMRSYTHHDVIRLD